MSSVNTEPPVASFGTRLGMAPGDVPVYSSDYASADDRLLPNRHAYRSYVDGIYMGYKWQCVEFARRWLYRNLGYVFDNVAMAYDIFMLRSVRTIRDNRMLPLKSFRNGSRRHPEPGCMLIWDEGGEFEETGHVAIVTELSPEWIRIAEQNLDHHLWNEGQTYSRELKARVDSKGGYWIECSFDDAQILGWVIQTEDATHAEAIADIQPALLNLQMREIDNAGQAERPWLDIDKPDEAAFVFMMGGHQLTDHADDQFKYLRISESAQREIKHATNELHAMFMHATDHVMQDDALLNRFNIPPAVWPKLRQSWDDRRNHMITGRLDFSLSDRGVKLYEYNADSASCYMECGKVQGKWAEHFGCSEGRSPGKQLHEHLVHAWKKSGIKAVLHVMHDSDPEESYHALYMQSAMEEAGIRCKTIKGIADLAWAADGHVVDADGERISHVWKTWAWETALDQLREQCAEDDEIGLGHQPTADRSRPPRLMDVLLRKDVKVFEPLWTLIPSNKAILAVLWQLYPDHPYLLDSQFEVTDALRRKGYVTKPIVGRCGANISITDKHDELVKETSGRFADQDQVYQEFFKLPRIGGYNVQISSFSVDGRYAGACVRVDPSPILTSRSDLFALRVIPDKELLENAP